MTEMVGRYKLCDTLTNSDAGNCRWGFATYRGKEYFVKEFLAPVYPTDTENLDPAMVERRRRQCDSFVAERQLVFRQLNSCSDGNLSRVQEFFRYGSKFYVAMDKVTNADEHCLRNASSHDRIVLCRALARSLARMHAAGLVHGDIKMSNIVPYKTKSNALSAKIIDIDGCYWKTTPPTSPDDVMTDQVFMAPEVFLFIRDEEGDITEKADVFSMGMCMHQILTGDIPRFSSDYSYAYQSLLDGKSLEIDDSLGRSEREVISAMLLPDPEKRPSMGQVFDGFWGKGIPPAPRSDKAPFAGSAATTKKYPDPINTEASSKLKSTSALKISSDFERKPPPTTSSPPADDSWFKTAGDL